MLLLRDFEKNPLFPVGIVVSPDFGSDQTIYIGTRYQGIYRSVNGGRQWSQNLPILHRRITALVISPDVKVDKTLYAGVAQEGIYKTNDGGETWRLIYQDRSDNILLAISPRYKDDGTVLSTTSQGLKKTTDRGKTWDEIDSPHSRRYLPYESIALSKMENGTEVIMVTLKGNGLFRVDDHKMLIATCENVLNSNYAIKRIIFSPSFNIDHRIYFLADEGIFRSTNAGQTCELIKSPAEYEHPPEYIRLGGN